EPPVMLSARLKLQNHPFALDAGELRDLKTRYEQARVRKAAAIAVPTEHRYVSTRRRPKAAPAQMNAILDSGRIPAACFDLKPQKTLRAGVLRQHLHCLEVWERPEQTQRLGLGQPADDLSLAEKPNHAAIRHALQVGPDLISLQPCGPEAFRQAVSRHP